MQEAVEIAIALLNTLKLTDPTTAEIKKVAMTVVVYQEIKQQRSMCGRDLAKQLAALYGVDQKFITESAGARASVRTMHTRKAGL